MKKTKKKVPARALIFSAAAVLAAPMVDDEEEKPDAEAAEGDAEETDDAAAAEGDAEETPAEDATDTEPESESEDATDAKASEGRGLTVVANSGQPMRNTFWWGTLAIDLQGIKSKERVPALMDHDVSQRIGVFNSQRITERGFEMDGEFLQRSELAASVNVELRDGFPYEASVRVNPTRVEELGDGVEAQVNGYTLKGPAFIFRECELREVSLCTLGQDPNTTAAALSEGDGDLVLEVEQAGDAVVDGKPDAVAAERDRQRQLRAAAMPEQAELLTELLDGGVALSDGLARLHTDLRTRFRARHEVRHAAGKKLGDGNGSGGTATKLETQLAQIRQMPDTPAKWRKLYELDASIRDDFTSADNYVAWETEQQRQRN